MAEKDQTNRWRCTVVGCNPKLLSDEAQIAHHKETGHRTAKWPIRSAEGKKKAAHRNKTGYYDRFNVGEKSYAARGLGNFGDTYRDEHTGYGSIALDEMSDNDWGVSD